jgi:hypothetical protein
VTRPLTVHHIIPRKRGGLDILENLKTLCRNSHGIIHFGSGITGKTSTIRLSKTTYTRLVKHQKYGETMNDVVCRLIDVYEKHKGSVE